jgi:nondiscriminating aspartyl-tRNA synthetase
MLGLPERMLCVSSDKPGDDYKEERRAMERTLTAAVPEHVDGIVTVAGWLHVVRAQGALVFAVVRDRAGLVQVVAETPAEAERLRELGVESVLAVTGPVAREPRAPMGVEIRAMRVEAISPVDVELPLQINKRSLSAGLDVLLDHRAVSLRAPRVRAIFRVQHEISRAFSDFLTSQGFTRIHTPKLVCAGAEGGAEIFSVDYFETRAYLGQSPQFYKQMMVGVFERVYEIAPAYRAEKHDTTRHTNEFTSLDLEMGFIDSHEDVMAMENAWLCHLTGRLREECAPEFRLLGATVPDVPERIPRARLAEVQQAIGRCLGEPDLDPEGERLACAWAQERFGSEFLFVTHYGVEKRPFYAMADPEDPRLTLSFDLLFRGWEVTTGGQRLHRYEDYVTKMTQRGLDPAAFDFYLEAFRCGMPPHGGLGAGLERFTARLLDLGNIREATLFPRDRKRLVP